MLNSWGKIIRIIKSTVSNVYTFYWMLFLFAASAFVLHPFSFLTVAELSCDVVVCGLRAPCYYYRMCCIYFDVFIFILIQYTQYYWEKWFVYVCVCMFVLFLEHRGGGSGRGKMSPRNAGIFALFSSVLCLSLSLSLVRSPSAFLSPLRS